MNIIPLTTPPRRGRVLLGTVASALLLGGVALTQTSIVASDGPGVIPIASPASSDAETFAGRLAIVDATAGRVELSVVEVLSGEEAREAAVLAGDLPAGEDLPNDVYIRDVPEAPRSLAIDAQADVEIVDCSGTDGCQLRPVAVADLLTATVRPLNGDAAVWSITTEGGTVTTLAEIYLP